MAGIPVEMTSEHLYLKPIQILYLPFFTASVAAPTAPETKTATPRFEPTLGPVTAKSGSPPKNLGASVSIP